LKDGLKLFGRADDEDKAEALWEWRFGLSHNWGRHAIEALLPIHALINQHYDEDDQVFDI
jgi:hypothetical protein